MKFQLWVLSQQHRWAMLALVKMRDRLNKIIEGAYVVRSQNKNRQQALLLKHAELEKANEQIDQRIRAMDKSLGEVQKIIGDAA